MEYYAPNDLKLDSEDWVVVESKRGIEIGIVKLASKCVNDEDVTLPLKDILRIATEKIYNNTIKMKKMQSKH